MNRQKQLIRTVTEKLLGIFLSRLYSYLSPFKYNRG